MVSRTRSRSTTHTNGTWKRFGSTFGANGITTFSESCTDQIAAGDNYDFSVSRLWKEGGVINTLGNPDYYTAYFRDYTCDALHAGAVFAPITSYPGELPDAAYAAAAVARTNPSRPYVDVPVNVLELGDITRTLKSAGDNLVSQLAGNNIKYQFGIAPLVSDVVKLVNFNDQVERRITEIQKLRQRGLRKTIVLDRLTAQKTLSNITLQSQGGVLYQATTTGVGKRIVKAHVRWNPSVNLNNLSYEQMSKLAKKAVLGLTFDFSTAWEAMPWSWLIDWGSNIGDYLKANRNIIPASLASVRLMKHTQDEYKVPGGSKSGGYNFMSDIRVAHETKNRYAVSVSPTAQFPFLSGTQLGLLASLAIVRK